MEALRVSAESFGGDSMALFHVVEILPAYFKIQATITIEKPTAGLVFDYYSPGDFKFVAILLDTNQIVIGHRTAKG